MVVKPGFRPGGRLTFSWRAKKKSAKIRRLKPIWLAAFAGNTISRWSPARSAYSTRNTPALIATWRVPLQKAKQYPRFWLPHSRHNYTSNTGFGFEVGFEFGFGFSQWHSP
jgi:hypothetical protein